MVNFAVRAFDGTQNRITVGNFTTFAAVGGTQLNLGAANTGTGSSNTSVPDAAHTTTYRVSFAEPVSDVRFTIWDIDGPGSAVEHVRIPTVGAVLTSGTGITPSTLGWYRMRPPTANVNTEDSRYTLGVSFTGPITTFDINLSRPTPNGGATLDGQPGLALSGITFHAPC
ncbi:hypothetical protein [Pseudoclavibacter sp. VKM Ac-2888]|uniref:hypothetical protein n=1 Tax=Pseudoclavibacter sp. VKM Ac-2888 TaxID=2783830 RepID=UPI00188D1341|nr:hypothetical protein [Pseudoclavibacter sp. VKM Ac-2888]MBF4549473.1 hypothetical protein [Pseudoclavibacter sp. VKM Ac-2888]